MNNLDGIEKLSFYLVDAMLLLRSEHLVLKRFLQKTSLNAKVNNWGVKLSDYNIKFKLQKVLKYACWYHIEINYPWANWTQTNWKEGYENEYWRQHNLHPQCYAQFTFGNATDTYVTSLQWIG